MIYVCWWYMYLVDYLYWRLIAHTFISLLSFTFTDFWWKAMLYLLIQVVQIFIYIWIVQMSVCVTYLNVLAIYVSDQRIMYRSFMHRIIKWSLILSIFFYRGFKITMMIYKCNKELQTYTGIYKKKNKLNNKNDNFTFQMLF